VVCGSVSLKTGTEPERERANDREREEWIERARARERERVCVCERERARARSSALTGSLAKQAEAEQGERWADSVIGKLEEQRTLSSTLYIMYRPIV
jgi:hypothetical protein